MPGQKIPVSEKHSLEFLSKMEPRNISPDVMYVKRGNSNSDGSDSIIRDMSTSQAGLDASNEDVPVKVKTIQWITVVILCFVNLINYMDRYTIAGVLPKVKDHFVIGDDKGGLLQTAFVLSYMLFAPLFGYLGDRYNRKLIMAFGVFLWSLTTMAGSYMDTYGYFLFFRMLVGIGEASYSTIAPTIISDLFSKDLRSKMLAAFYFAIPVGSGLGYIVGSEMAELMGKWQWGLRVTPFAGIVAVILILFVMEEPPRGQSEGRSQLEATSWKSDIKILMKNPSFMLSTGGFTCVAFVTGALAWWGPQFIHYGLVLQPGYENTDLNSISLVFGVVTVTSGILGVPAGMLLSNWLKPIFPRIDPLICGFGLLSSAVFMVFVSTSCSENVYICFTLIFIAEFLISLNWSVANDITLYVVSPTRRSTAEAFQILVSHAFGDAGSPYLIGVLSEFFKKTLSSGTVSVLASAVAMTTISNGESSVVTPAPTPTDRTILFRSLQYALFTTCFVEVLGGLFFLLTALHVVEDRAAAERQLQGEDNPVATSDIYSDASDVETAAKHS